VHKLIKIKRKEINRARENQMIEDILTSTMSTKNINKNLTLGNKWTSYLLENGIKITDRKGINMTATKYYKQLYYDNTHITINNKENTIEEPSITPKEVEQIATKMKNNKAPGIDNIINEQLKYGGKYLYKFLADFFNKIIKENKIPKKWKLSKIILVFKKGEKHLIKNYRPISLTSNLAKIFAKIINNRMKIHYKTTQPEEQAGFQSGFSTITNLHIINQLIEKSQEYNMELHLAFVDYTKAFDTLKYPFLFDAMKKQNYPESFIRIIQEYYQGTKAYINTDVEGENFEILRGVKQGDPLSSVLFNVALQEIFRHLLWDDRGVDINGKILNNLRFADDVVLIANSKKDLEFMLRDLNKKGKIAGLEINFDKTNIIANTEYRADINIEARKVKKVIDE
jgi:hypothetical protein